MSLYYALKSNAADYICCPMHTPVQHIINNHHFWLSPQRCIYWEEGSALILSDLHFGKTGHFRKHGIAVPQNIYKEDLQRLVDQVIHFKPRRIIAVGDLFHSNMNKELDLFLKWRNDFEQIEFILVRGNHDILHDDWYAKASIEVKEECYYEGDFGFVHDPQECSEETKGYIFSGHLHPAIQLTGIANQSLRFPCFYFSERQAILPAFSKFSGLASVRKKKGDQVFAIVNEKIVSL